MARSIPVAKVVEKGDFADAKFYTIEGEQGFFRKLKKPADGSVVALHDETTLKTHHFQKVWPPAAEQKSA